MRYFVIASRWDEEKECIIKTIVGEFTEYIMASIFKEAYNEHFSADAKVVEESKLLNE